MTRSAPACWLPTNAFGSKLLTRPCNNFNAVYNTLDINYDFNLRELGSVVEWYHGKSGATSSIFLITSESTTTSKHLSHISGVMGYCWANLVPRPNYSLGSSRFQPKFSPKLIQSSQHFQNDQTNQNIQKDYKTKYKKVKAKLALLEAGPSSTQTTKPFQSKNKGIVAETFDYDKEKVSSDDEKMVQVKVLMTLVKEEQLTIGKNHARNDEITMRKNVELLRFEEGKRENFKKYKSPRQGGRGGARSSTNNMDRAKKKMPTSSIPWASSSAGMLVVVSPDQGEDNQ
ncbi:hypothetical protein Tco_1121706 [Tanacetum coccineum]|uniref:Uncharacterized protein n=1 Tax=Tanacetum coccineum TaxID=301880 RepID=A0ABQ5IYG6_9ASTR